MIRLSAFLCLIMACMSSGTVLGQAFINAPKTVCTSITGNERYATMNAAVTGLPVTDTRWTISPGVVGTDYKVLYGVVNVSQAANQSVVIEFLKPGTYTVTADMTSGGAPYAAGPVQIVAKDCPMPVCKGASTTTAMAGFLEDFGTASARMSLDPARGTTQYTSNATGVLQKNEYSIYNTTNLLSPDWIVTGDHTRNTDGGMMIVNCGDEPNVFYRRTVSNLCKGAVYKFGAWLKNIDTQTFFENGCGANYNYAGVTFEIRNAANNALLATFNSNDLSTPLQSTLNNYGWQQYEFSFKTTPGINNVIVQMLNNNPGGCGNNIAIDDISFSYCSPFIYSFFDGQTDQLGGQYTMCAGSPTNLTSAYTPTGYFNIPHYFWQYSKDSINWTTLSGDGDGVSGTNTDVLSFVEGALLLEGDSVSITDLYFRLQIYEDGNTESCAAPSVPIKVTLLPNPRVVVPDNEICIGDTATLVATGGFDSYTWDTPLDTTADSVKVWPDITIAYTVTGYKTYGGGIGRTCQRTGQAIVIVDDKPVVDSITGPYNICLGQEVDLKIDDALALYNILWTPTSAVTTAVKDTPATVGINTWSVTVTNGMCVVTATKDITVMDIPVPDAGADTIRQCNDGNFTMAAVLGAGETGLWSIAGPANGAVITTNDNPMTPITGLGGGQSVTLIWSVQKTSNPACISTDTVVLINVAVPISSLAGPDQTQCGTSDAFTMAANTPPAGAIGTWDLKQGTAVIGDINLENTTITVTGIQDVMLTWTVSNLVCPGKPDTIILSKTNPPNIVLGTVPGSCSNTAAFILPYTSVSDNPDKYDVAVAATNAMPGFTAITNQALGADSILAPYPAGTAAGAYDFDLTIKHDGLGCSTIVPFSVTVETPAVVPTAVIADKPELCAGDNVTLTLQGGSLNAGANWTWYADACGGTSIGTGLTITVPVSNTTTFYVRAESAGACGNSGCAAVVVTVVTSPPAATFVPAPLTVECQQGQDYTTLFGVPQFSHTPYTTIPVTVSAVDQTVVNGCEQTITRTWTATDPCGLTATASQTITIADKTAPVFITAKPADLTVNCDAIPAAINLDALDDCTGAMTIVPTETQQAIPGECANNYLLMRTWTATDPCNNSRSVTQVITVKELTPPAFTTPAPADVTVNCDAIPVAATLTATEYCTGNAITATVSDIRQDISSSTCSANYQLIRTWTAMDPCGNSSTVSQTITVQDITRPVFTVPPPADITVDCDAIPAPPDNITATDNCSTVSISRTQTQEPINVPGACGSFRILRTWTATDECGNATVAQQAITVICDGLPGISLGNDTTLCQGEALKLRAEGNGIVNVLWSDGSTGPYLHITETGTYNVTVSNKCGSATDQVTVTVTPCDPKPTFANAFSPNGDGQNDLFRPVVTRGIMYGYQLRIYNRWGQLIYGNADPKKGWDGTLQEGPRANIGAYIWWVTYKKEPNGTPIVLNGIVNVIR